MNDEIVSFWTKWLGHDLDMTSNTSTEVEDIIGYFKS